MRKLGIACFDPITVTTRAEYFAAYEVMMTRALGKDAPSEHVALLPDGSRWQTSISPRQSEEHFVRRFRAHAEAVQVRLDAGEAVPAEDMRLLGHIEALLSITPMVHQLEDELEAIRHQLERARNPLRRVNSKAFPFKDRPK